MKTHKALAPGTSICWEEKNHNHSSWRVKRMKKHHKILKNTSNLTRTACLKQNTVRPVPSRTNRGFSHPHSVTSLWFRLKCCMASEPQYSACQRFIGGGGVLKKKCTYKKWFPNVGWVHRKKWVVVSWNMYFLLIFCSNILLHKPHMAPPFGFSTSLLFFNLRRKNPACVTFPASFSSCQRRWFVVRDEVVVDDDDAFIKPPNPNESIDWQNH